MKIINLTPHQVTLLNDNGEVIEEYEPMPISARVSVTPQVLNTLGGVNIVRNRYGRVEGLPESKPEVYYIVSMLVQQAKFGMRGDLLSPNDAVRDSAGRIIGCKSWCVLSQHTSYENINN